MNRVIFLVISQSEEPGSASRATGSWVVGCELVVGVECVEFVV